MNKEVFEKFIKHIQEENNNYKKEQNNTDEWKYGTFNIHYHFPEVEIREIEINTDAIFIYIEDFVIINNIDIDDKVYCFDFNKILLLETL